jgi:hypothetical protein
MKTSIHSHWKAVLPLLLCILGFGLAAPRVHAQATANPPSLMTYQGYLVDVNGTALGTNAPKNYDVIFRVWDSASGGTELWGEQQTVTVDKGYFNVLLGEGSSIGEPRPVLNTIFTNSTASDRYIGITVKGIGTGGADSDILPRLRLLTSPYSFLAQTAVRAQSASSVDGAGVTTGTVPDARLSANVALRNSTNTFSGNQVINGNVGIGTAAPGRPLQVGDASVSGSEGMIRLASRSNAGGANRTWDIGVPQTGQDVSSNGYSFVINDTTTAATDFMVQYGTGNVGLGTSTPGFPLTMPNTLGDKISLYGQSGSSLGFGIQSGVLQIHTDTSGNDIVLGYGSSASMTERMRVKGSGNVGIGTSTPAAKLHVVDSTYPTGVFDSSSPYGTWLALGNSSAGGRYWQFISGGSSNGAAPGSLLFGNGTSAGSANSTVCFATNGTIGIGTLSPLQPLHIKRDTNPGIRLENTNNSFDIYNETCCNGLIINKTGQAGYFKIAGDGTTSTGSDRRLKKNISTLENVLDRVAQLRPVRYQMKDETGVVPTHIGFIAQEVEPLFPEFVSEADGYKCVSYAGMVSIAIAAVKELNQTVAKQKIALSEQSEKMSGVAKELADLKKQLAVQTQAQAELLAKDRAREDRMLALEQIVHERNSETASLKAQ